MELDCIAYPDPNGFSWNQASGPWTTTRQPDQIVDWVFGELGHTGLLHLAPNRLGYPRAV